MSSIVSSVSDFMCQCCELFRGLYYRDMLDNLVKFNDLDMSKLIKDDPEEDIFDDKFKWEFDEKEESITPPVPVKEAAITEQPKSLGTGLEDSVASHGALGGISRAENKGN